MAWGPEPFGVRRLLTLIRGLPEAFPSEPEPARQAEMIPLEEFARRGGVPPG